MDSEGRSEPPEGYSVKRWAGLWWWGPGVLASDDEALQPPGLEERGGAVAEAWAHRDAVVAPVLRAWAKVLGVEPTSAEELASMTREAIDSLEYAVRSDDSELLRAWLDAGSPTDDKGEPLLPGEAPGESIPLPDVAQWEADAPEPSWWPNYDVGASYDGTTWPSHEGETWDRVHVFVEGKYLWIADVSTDIYSRRVLVDVVRAVVGIAANPSDPAPDPHVEAEQAAPLPEGALEWMAKQDCVFDCVEGEACGPHHPAHRGIERAPSGRCWPCQARAVLAKAKRGDR